MNMSPPGMFLDPNNWHKLAQTWPARLAKSAWEAATLPGDVYQGRVTPSDPAYYDRAADLAQLAVGTPIKAPTGAFGSGFTLDYFGSPVKIFENLSPRQLEGFLSRTKYKAARRITDPETGTVYVWDAADPALHAMVAEKLGVKAGKQHWDTIGID